MLQALEQIFLNQVMDDKTEKIEEQEGIAGSIKELKKKADEVGKEETELKSSRSELYIYPCTQYIITLQWNFKVVIVEH